jgi:hypothetical protein
MGNNKPEYTQVISDSAPGGFLLYGREKLRVEENNMAEVAMRFIARCYLSIIPGFAP